MTVQDITQQRTMFEKMRNKRVPEYYDTMYQDGFSPSEIREALHTTMIQEYNNRMEERLKEEPEEPMNVVFKVEVKRK